MLPTPYLKTDVRERSCLNKGNRLVEGLVVGDIRVIRDLNFEDLSKVDLARPANETTSSIKTVTISAKSTIDAPRLNIVKATRTSVSKASKTAAPSSKE